MTDFMFFVKTFFLTVVVVVLMQIHIGEKSIETHAMSWVQSSSIVQPLNSVARGGVKIVRDAVHSISSRLNRQSHKNGNHPSSESAESSAHGDPD